MSESQLIPADRSVSVRVPATSANLGSGFDSFGLALSLFDDVTITTAVDGQFVVDIEGEGADDLPRDERHLIVALMQDFLAGFGYTLGGLRLAAVNRIPHARGLGSSAAATTAALLLANAVLPAEHEQSIDTLLGMAAQYEGHPDNVAPALFGGCTIAIQTGQEIEAVTVSAHEGLSTIAFIPQQQLATSAARSVLPELVPHSEAARNAGFAGMLAAGLTTGDLRAIFSGTQDELHQKYRAQDMPKSMELISQLRANHIAGFISGAGPTVVAIVSTEFSESATAQINHNNQGMWRVENLAIDLQGARIKVH